MPPPPDPLADVQNFVDLKLLSGAGVDDAVIAAEEQFGINGLAVDPVGMVSVSGKASKKPAGLGQAFSDQDDPESRPDEEPRKYLNAPEIDTE